jgi:hypothetical protein
MHNHFVERSNIDRDGDTRFLTTFSEYKYNYMAQQSSFISRKGNT